MYHTYAKPPSLLNGSEAVCTDFGLPSLGVSNNVSDSVKPLFDMPTNPSSAPPFGAESDSEDIGISAEQFEAIQNVLGSPNRELSPRRPFRAIDVSSGSDTSDSESDSDSDGVPSKIEVGISLADGFKRLRNAAASEGEKCPISAAVHFDHSYTHFVERPVPSVSPKKDGSRRSSVDTKRVEPVEKAPVKLPEEKIAVKVKEKSPEKSPVKEVVVLPKKGREREEREKKEARRPSPIRQARHRPNRNLPISMSIETEVQTIKLMNGSLNQSPTRVKTTKVKTVIKKRSPPKESKKREKSDDSRPEEPDLHICNVCSQPFRRESHLKSHILTQHPKKTEKKNAEKEKRRVPESAPNDPKLYICKVCSQPFRRENQLKSHLQSHEDVKEEKKPVELPLLRKTAAALKQLPDSILKTNTRKPKKNGEMDVSGMPDSELHCCPVCWQPFLREAHLKTHLQTHNVTAEKYAEMRKETVKVEDKEGKRTKKKDEKEGKKKKEEVGKKKKEEEEEEAEMDLHCCPICSQPFNREANLRTHMQTHKAGERVTRASEKISELAEMPRKRAKVGISPPSLRCDVCHLKFREESYLNEHRVVHEKRARIHLERHSVSDDSEERRGRRDSDTKKGRNERDVKRGRNEVENKRGRNEIEPKRGRNELEGKRGRNESEGRRGRNEIEPKRGRNQSDEDRGRNEPELRRGRKNSEEKQSRNESELKRGRHGRTEKQGRNEPKEKKEARYESNSRRSKEKSGLKRARNESTTDDEELHCCPICGQPFNRESQLKRHLLSHNETESKPVSVKPIIEKKRARNKPNVEKKRSKSATGDSRASFQFETDFEIHCCVECGQPFRREANLKAHLLMHSA